MDRLNTLFRDYNGRYFGNFLVLILTRSKLLTILVKAAAFTFACWTCYCYCKKRSVSTLLFSFALLLIIPRLVLREAVVWTSGFSNYVPPALISIVYLNRISCITEKEPQKESGFIVNFLLAFSGGLFMENITVFNIVLGAVVIGFVWIKWRRFYRAHIGFLIGAILGAVVIFSNSSYAQIAAGTGYYREVPHTLKDTLLTIWYNAQAILDYLVFENAWLCLVITVILLLLAFHIRKDQSNEINKRRILYASVANVVVLGVIFYEYLVYSHIQSVLPDVLIRPAFIFHEMRSFTALGYVLSVVILIALCAPKEWKFKILLPLFCVPVAMAPLLVVQPIGPRCVFLGYLLMMMCACSLFTYLWTEVLNRKFLQRIISTATAAMIVVQLVRFSFIFIPIYYWDNQRNTFAKFQSDTGKNTVYLCTLPNEEYLHNSSPTGGNLIERYILFYGLREDVTLEFVPSQELKQMISEQIP